MNYLIITSLVILPACIINYYAVLSFLRVPAGRRNNRKWWLAFGLSMITSLMVFYFRLVPGDRPDYMIWGGITGISFAAIRFRRFYDNVEVEETGRTGWDKTIVLVMVFGVNGILGSVLGLSAYSLLHWIFRVQAATL